MDWNHDGKHDWRDDALFHNIISNDHTGNSTPPPTGPSGNSSILPTLVPIVYLGALLPGTIPINSFTMLIGLVCAGSLFAKFIKWLF